MTFPNSIQKDRGQPSLVRIGTIGADGTLIIQNTVYSTDAVGVLGSYNPVEGETVAVLGQSAIGTAGSSWLILGSVTQGMSPTAAYADRITVGSVVASVTFTVPSALRRIEVDWTGRSDVAAATTAVQVRINGISSADYGDHRIEAVGAGAAAGILSAPATSWTAGALTGDAAGAGFYSPGHLEIPGWDEPHGTSLGFIYQASSFTSGGVSNSGGGLLLANGPFTTITLFPLAGSWMEGSDFQLLGWPS